MSRSPKVLIVLLAFLVGVLTGGYWGVHFSHAAIALRRARKAICPSVPPDTPLKKFPKACLKAMIHAPQVVWHLMMPPTPQWQQNIDESAALSKWIVSSSYATADVCERSLEADRNRAEHTFYASCNPAVMHQAWLSIKPGAVHRQR